MKTRFLTTIIIVIVITTALVSFEKKNTVQVITDHQERSLTFITNADGTGVEKIVTPNRKPMGIKAFAIPERSYAFSNGETFEEWKEALAFKESRGDYEVVNRLGYMGKYQFGKATLRDLGINDSIPFLEDAQLQEAIFLKYVKHNYRELAPYIKKYSGRKIGGVVVTESGILAAAHLSGAGGVKKFLSTNGDEGKKDAFGTTIRSYMTKFAGYDLSAVLD
jgi:hypothetical protein